MAVSLVPALGLSVSVRRAPVWYVLHCSTLLLLEARGRSKDVCSRHSAISERPGAEEVRQALRGRLSCLRNEKALARVSLKNR